MIKMAAETKTNPQQTGIGIVSMTGWGSAGAIVTGTAGGATGVAVRVTSG